VSTSAQCPICEGTVPTDGATFPFCSMRCKSVDLGHWLDGTYTDEDEDEDELSA
jgi:endogenous inhibitor of DNA gyrase (YacG/DUF329 family)